MSNKIISRNLIPVKTTKHFQEINRFVQKQVIDILKMFKLNCDTIKNSLELVLKFKDTSTLFIIIFSKSQSSIKKILVTNKYNLNTLYRVKSKKNES